MESPNAIELSHVSKSFEMTVADLTKPKTLGNRVATVKVTNTVIDDVSFTIKKGEITGILGRNGSGKSTILGLIAGILTPDNGTVNINGKLASILELGMGFNGDMSGRDNIYLKAEMYGLSRKTIDDKIEDIIAYSGIGKYIDSPVRTYSSGMTGRLAFSVMISVEAEIMIVDEVLSTGDASFSARALEHFKKLAKSGKTILFVSHNVKAIEDMCTRAMWLEGGKIKADGPTKKITSLYNNAIASDPAIVMDFAESGMADYQYKLALMYRDGQNLPKDEGLYHAWLQKSAESGYALAQVEYADHLIATGNPEDAENAKAFYQSAADKGNADARVKIATLHGEADATRTGIIDLYRQLAENGNPVMQSKYGEVLLKTAWNNNDRKEAFTWYARSAEQGNLPSIQVCAIMCRDGVGIPKDIRMMVEYLEKGASLHYLPSITLLADLYYEGKNVIRDEEKAFRLYLEAAKLGSTKHMYMVATMYKDGVGIPVDIRESDRWFKLFSHAAAVAYEMSSIDPINMFDVDTGLDIPAMVIDSTQYFKLGAVDTLLRYSIIGKTDVSRDEAIRMMDEMASVGNIDAIRKLASYYQTGFGVEKNLEKTLEYVRKGISLGDVASMTTMAGFLVNGTGVEKDIDAALGYYKYAQASGNFKALISATGLYTSGLKEPDEYFWKNVESMKRMAEYGNIDAVRKLTEMYMKGQCVSKNLAEAKKWCSIGVALMDSQSIKSMNAIVEAEKALNSAS